MSLRELLTLVFKVVLRHLTEEELLAAVLDVHRQAAETSVGVVDAEGLLFLPLVPVAHQDEGQADADAVVRDTLQQGTVGLVLVELGDFEYEESKKVFWDNYSVIKTAERKGEMKGREEGRIEGREEGRIEIARKMKDKGFSANDIAEITGLSTSEITNL